jgi:chorismate mutase
MLVCRGIRGATTVENDIQAEVLAATGELLMAIIDANDIKQEDVASVYFTTTPDIVSEYPALAARQLGWTEAALLCGHEMAVPGGLKKCIRILIHWNTTKSIKEIKHIYLNGAESLRPDLALRQLKKELGENGGDG